MPTKLKVIMFTDRASSSEEAARSGDAIRARVTQRQEQLTRDVAATTRGFVVKSLGDGHLLTFDSAIDAVRAGLRLQRRIAEHNNAFADEEQLQFHLRIGIDVGDVEVDGRGDVLGHSADIAKRVESEAEPDHVFFTERVRVLLPPQSVTDEVAKRVTLKGAIGEQTLYRVLDCQGESMHDFHNPFIVGGAIVSPAEFFGRKQNVSFALNRIRTMQSVSIVGERGIGKSSLLHYLLQIAPEQLGQAYRPIYIDLLRPDARSLSGVLTEIQRQLGLTTPVLTLIEFAERMLLFQTEGVRPLIALDELEMFIRLPGEFSQDFCETLRAIASARQIILLTASRVPLRDLHDQGALVSPLYNIMGSIILSPFNDNEAREFVAAPRPSVSFSQQQVTTILERGQGHPFRLQILCWHVAEANHDGRKDLENVWQEAREEIEMMLGNSW